MKRTITFLNGDNKFNKLSYESSANEGATIAIDADVLSDLLGEDMLPAVGECVTVEVNVIRRWKF